MDVSLSSLPQFVDGATPLTVHLVGIAGAGMRSLADVLLGFGWTITGSDLDVESLAALANRGVRLFAGHASAHVSPKTQLLIYSDAVPDENPERRRAAQLGIPAINYVRMLARLGVGRRTIAIAGTHGKSTASAMLAHLLVQAGHDPTVVYGATPLDATSGGRAGRGRTAVVEACEYRQNFLNLHPEQAAILDVESDHFDCYDSPAQLEKAFRQFAKSLPDDGLLVVRRDCPAARRIAAVTHCRKVSFGLVSDADWFATLLAEDHGRYRIKILRFGQPFCDVLLSQPGKHNVLNALAAAVLAYENNLSSEQISHGLASFPGLRRRLELHRFLAATPWVDDYAHHPTEVIAALQTVRQMFPNARLWCAFQPHQASRTARLLDELAIALKTADRIMVAEIFRAREGEPRPGEVSAADLARRAAHLGAIVLPGTTIAEILETLESQLAAGDVFVTLGAGDLSARLRAAAAVAPSRAPIC